MAARRHWPQADVLRWLTILFLSAHSPKAYGNKVKCPSNFTLPSSWCVKGQAETKTAHDPPLKYLCEETPIPEEYSRNATISRNDFAFAGVGDVPVLKVLHANMTIVFEIGSVDPGVLALVLEAPDFMIFKIRSTWTVHSNIPIEYGISQSSLSIFNGGSGASKDPFFRISPASGQLAAESDGKLVYCAFGIEFDTFRSTLSVIFEAVPGPRSQFNVFCYSDNQGYIQTPEWNGVNRYGSKSKSCVTIMVPDNHVIMISLISLELENTADCHFDTLTLHKTADCQGKGDKICQLEDFEPAIENSRVLSFLFVTDSQIEKAGFRFLYSFHPVSAQPVKAPGGKWICSVLYYKDFQQHFQCRPDVLCSDGRDKTGCGRETICGGVDNIVREEEDKCYRLFSGNPENYTWNEAAGKCESFRGHLAELSSMEKRELFFTITKELTEDVVFEGFRLAPFTAPEMYQFTWVWSHNTVAVYLNISLKKSDQVHECGISQTADKRAMTTVPCDEERAAAFICEVETGIPAENSIYVTNLLPILEPVTLKPTMASCSHEQTAHAFLACDVATNCSAVDFESSSYCAENLFTPKVPFFTCATTSERVPYSLVCDHRSDCCDSSDEDFCQFPPCVGREEFTCANKKQCIPREQRCDNHRDCVDESDEFKCKATLNPRDIRKNIVLPPARVDFTGNGDFIVTALNSPSCPDTHFRCPGKEAYCMPVYVLCNAVFDCPGKEDEAGCDAYTCPGFYRCRASRICVHQKHLCDGVNHCPQRDDEFMCDLICPKSCTCYGHAFICENAFPADAYPNLRYLDASGTGMTLSIVSTNRLLIYLSLRHCGITDIGSHDLSNLQSLDLSYNDLASVSASDLNRFSNLRSLSLAHNPLVSLDRLINYNYTFPILDQINFAGLTIPELKSSFSKAFPNVQDLNLSHSGLHQLPESGFQAFGQLETLDIRWCSLETTSPGVFQGLWKLKTVYTDNYKLCCPSDLPAGFDPQNCNAPVDEVSSCDALLLSEVFRVFLSIYALLSLLGNLGSFVYRTFFEKVTVKMGFDVFVTHLCVSDFLMGVYLAIIGIADRMYYGDYRWNDLTWRYSTACKVAGFLSLLSSEMSAFFICLITLERFLVVGFPLKKIRFRRWSAHVICFNLWIIGMLLAAVPLLPHTEHWEFYSQSGICIPLPITRNEFPGKDYAFGVMIGLNFILCVFIAAGQFLIYWFISANSMPGQNSNKKSRDMTVARRLIAVAMTDFLCWFPIGLLGILARSGVPIPGDVNVGMAIFVLPFNSALNPFLYTVFVAVKQHSKIRQERVSKERRTNENNTNTTHTSAAERRANIFTVGDQNKVSTTEDALRLFNLMLEKGLLPMEHVRRRVVDKDKVTS